MSCKEFYDAGFSSFEDYEKALREWCKDDSEEFFNKALSIAKKIYYDNEDGPEPIVKEMDLDIGKLKYEKELIAEIEDHFDITDPAGWIESTFIDCANKFHFDNVIAKIKKITINETPNSLTTDLDGAVIPISGSIHIFFECFSNFGSHEFTIHASLSEDRKVIDAFPEGEGTLIYDYLDYKNRGKTCGQCLYCEPVWVEHEAFGDVYYMKCKLKDRVVDLKNDNLPVCLDFKDDELALNRWIAEWPPELRNAYIERYGLKDIHYTFLPTCKCEHRKIGINDIDYPFLPICL